MILLDSILNPTFYLIVFLSLVQIFILLKILKLYKELDLIWGELSSISKIIAEYSKKTVVPIVKSHQKVLLDTLEAKLETLKANAPKKSNPIKLKDLF